MGSSPGKIGDEASLLFGGLKETNALKKGDDTDSVRVVSSLHGVLFLRACETALWSTSAGETTFAFFLLFDPEDFVTTLAMSSF